MDIIDPKKVEQASVELSSKVRRQRCVSLGRRPPVGTGLLLAGYEECRPDYLIERSGFPFWTLEFVVSGRGRFDAREARSELRHGSVFCHGPGLDYRIASDRSAPLRKYFLVRGDRRFPAGWQRAGLGPGRALQLGEGLPLSLYLDQVLEQAGNGDGPGRRIAAALESVLLGLVERHGNRRQKGPDRARNAYEIAVDLICRDYAKLHSLRDLAVRTGYSPEYLCRVFRRHRDASPYQALLHQKMNAALMLLRDGFRVDAVAREVGFEDPLHFSRRFRSLMGFPPSHARAR